MLLSGSAFNRANSSRCSLQTMGQMSQLLKGLGLWEEHTADHLDHGHCLPAASPHCCLTGSVEQAEPFLAFLHNMGHGTGLSRVISQRSLAAFPGCFPGPLCYAVKALQGCDHGDKTNHDGSAVKGSRLCKNKQTGLPCSQQSAPSPCYQETKWVSRDGVPGISCLASDSVIW